MSDVRQDVAPRHTFTDRLNLEWPMLTVALVVMVIFLFLRNVWATIIPSASGRRHIVGKL